MLADPIRGRFTGVSTDGLIMPAIAGVCIQIANHHLAGILDIQTLLPAGLTSGFLVRLSVFALVSHLVFSFSFLHRFRARSRSMLLVALLCSCATLTYILAFYLVMSHRAISYAGSLSTFFTAAFLYQALRYKLRSAYLLRHQETVMILGTGREAQKMWKHIRIHCDQLVAFRGFVGKSTTYSAAPDIMARTVCAIDSLERYLHSNVVDTLVLTANSPEDLIFAKESIRIAQNCGIRLLCVNEAYEDLPPAQSLQTICESYVDFERPTMLQQISRSIKTVVDRALAGVAILVLTPVAAPLLLFYRLILGESLLVSQSVYGYHRRSFTMWNVRTVSTSQWVISAASQKGTNDASFGRSKLASRIGHFLQVSGLSQAPSLWNVCAGQMSLVGPTPIPRTQASLDNSNVFLRRYTMRPGLCWPEAETEEVSALALVDEAVTISYLQHWSLTLDWLTLRHWVGSRVRRSLQSLSTPMLTNPSTLTTPTPRAR